MKQALMVIGYVSFGIGSLITILTLIFAFSIGIRILGVLVAIVGVIWFLGFVVWSWWTECVIEPLRKKKKAP